MIGVLLLALTALQENDPAALVERLADNDIQVRERAGRRLVEMGVPARAALERAAAGRDPEIAARARSILGEIALEEHRRMVLGPTGRITLPVGEYSLEQISAAVKEQTAIPLALPEKMGSQRIRIGADASNAWDFLAEVSRIHGGLRFGGKPPEGSFAFEAGPPLNAPSVTSGPFRVWIDRLRLERRIPAGTAWNRGILVLGVAWQPNVKPIGDPYRAPPTVEITELQTDDRVALRIKPEKESVYGSYDLGAYPAHGYRELIEFEHPPVGARRLALLRGHVDIRLPHPLQSCTFDNPALAGGQERRLGSFAIRLKEFLPGKEQRALLTCWRLPEPGETAPAQDPVGLDSRLSAQDVLLVDDQGKEYPGVQRSAGFESRNGGNSYSVLLGFPAGAVPASLKVRFMAGHFERRVDFEYKDIELP